MIANSLQNENPLLSGIHAPQGSLTAQGPATEPMGIESPGMSPKMKMALALMAQGLGNAGSSMAGGGAIPPSRATHQPLDIYGNPVGGM